MIMSRVAWWEEGESTSHSPLVPGAMGGGGGGGPVAVDCGAGCVLHAGDVAHVSVL